MNTYQKSYTAFMESVCNQFNCKEALPVLTEGFNALCEAVDPNIVQDISTAENIWQPESVQYVVFEAARLLSNTCDITFRDYLYHSGKPKQSITDNTTGIQFVFDKVGRDSVRGIAKIGSKKSPAVNITEGANAEALADAMYNVILTKQDDMFATFGCRGGDYKERGISMEGLPPLD
jgi:hypothetical protein